MEYWLSTKSKMNLNPRDYENPEREQYLRDNVGVDAALLAVNLKLSVPKVIAYQHRLGLRPLVPAYYKKAQALHARS